ncbi:hypothetical protein [Macrococcus carouselicus]|uniref:Uncharacterized protein n=1 Tax=Macrococcus carouselicus TaxID=69969 RepID=A0A9Q8CJP1_9STAP|nr:hypothetical protein [Macrococcus carouselicus]TDL96605.1 hypothetical protein ERX40_09625 [Macrococcus carouselicus]
MNELCDCAELLQINVSADYGADPLWCGVCHLNLDIDAFTLSDSLEHDLFRWTNRYGEWLDLDTDTLIPAGTELETKHNDEGRFLTKRLQDELPHYHFDFVPSADSR